MIGGTARLFSLLCLAVVCASACVNPPAPSEPPAREKKVRPSIEEVQKRLTDKVMALPGVVGTAIGEKDGQPCIKVLIARMSPLLEKEIPSQIEGFPVVTDVTGDIRAREPR